MNLLDDKHIIFTSHARERMKSFQLDIPKALELLKDCVPEKIPKGKKKFSREGIKCFRNGSYVFTMAEVMHKRFKTPSYLLLSVYDQRMDWQLKHLIP